MAQGYPPPGQHAKPSATIDEIGLPRFPLPQTVDWEREAASLTFYLDPNLFLAAARDIVPGVAAELIWIYQAGPAQPITLYVYPVLIVHAPYKSLRVEHVKLHLHLHTGDPLLRHVILVLQAVLDSVDMASRLYAEAITNALAVHLLRRYAAHRLPPEVCPGGLPKPKLQRVIEYIEAHLEQELLLTEIASVVQMSPDHFARLFRRATGRTPHHDWPIIDISRRVGFTDQSYFTAVFRKNVATTPKGYRDEIQR
jgi:AraC-like DNA-binding protein